jgi:hypothetical protein
MRPSVDGEGLSLSGGTMTGEIIHFQSLLDLKRGGLYGKRTVRRDAAAAPRLKEPGVVRASEMPAPASAGGEDVRRILQTLPWSGRRADLVDEGEGDPQPDIDYETLDRMYGVLNSSI